MKKALLKNKKWFDANILSFILKIKQNVEFNKFLSLFPFPISF
jgi:hypothetical protein